MKVISLFKEWGIYTNVSLLKLFIGALILILTLLTLNVKEDPEIALSFFLVGFFVFCWGVSYFVFYAWEILILLGVSSEKMKKDAYKASFLFGLYALTNVLLLIGGWWTKPLGILLFLWFVALQVFLFIPKPLKLWQ